jgi:NDP-sugar pyrophosphorylase family protein
MILGAGLGTRLRPLSELRPKPAVPVRGLPLIAYPLALLARHGVSEVVVNVHHQPQCLIEAAERYAPPGLRVRFSHEKALLGTGGGIRRAAAFLRESDPCLILSGDMLLDLDLSVLIGQHRERRDAWTLLLRDDPRGRSFGTIGIDAGGRIRRIARRFDLGGEQRAGLYVHVTVMAARAFDTLPEREVFGHLDGWVAPLLQAGAQDIRAEILGQEQCVWEPVGTPAEYLAANLHPPSLSFLDADARAMQEGVRFARGLVIGAGAEIGPGARLEDVVVWEGERVPSGFVARRGVFAGGRFHPCPEASAESEDT